MEKWSVRQGRTIRKKITLRYKADATDGSYYAGDPIVGVYSGTEPLTLEVYTGDTEPVAVLPASTVVWIEATNGTIRATVTCPADLAAQVYRLIVTLSKIGELYDAFEAQLEVLGASDADTVPLPTYASFPDCLNICPWIGDIIATNPGMQSDLAEQRADARAWWDEVLQHHSRGGSGSYYDGSLAWNLNMGRNPWLQEQLDANRLLLTRPIRRANAYYAVALALESQIGSRGDTSYQMLASQYRADADSTAKTIVAELDTNDDGAGDHAIDLSYVPLVRG